MCTGSPGRVVDILEASGAFDPGSNPGRDVIIVAILEAKYMITGELKNKVDRLWEMFWTGGLIQSSAGMNLNISSNNR